MQFNINWKNILHLTHDYCYNKKNTRCFKNIVLSGSLFLECDSDVSHTEAPQGSL